MISIRNTTVFIQKFGVNNLHKNCQKQCFGAVVAYCKQQLSILYSTYITCRYLLYRETVEPWSEWTNELIATEIGRNHEKIVFVMIGGLIESVCYIFMKTIFQSAEWSVCSHSCGKGTKTRRVQCIREISQSQGRVMKLILPLQQCPKDVPQSWQSCNVEDCPPVWKTGAWSQVGQPQGVSGGGTWNSLVMYTYALLNLELHWCTCDCGVKQLSFLLEKLNFD